MEFTIKPLHIVERKYTYAQSMQLEGQTGCIGHLRGDFDTSGYGFYTTWEDHRKQWKTDEFKSDFDDVINALRSDEYGLLKSRPDMLKYARQQSESAFSGSYTTEYGFRADTQKYAFLFRCNPAKGDYNFYCYCFVAEWLDQHIEKAKQDIRFINSHYKTLFRLPDGAQITITNSQGEKHDYACRYIDETHLEVGNNLFHICEFAERMEQNGSTYQPKEEPLPIKCFSVRPLDNEMIILARYERGFTPSHRIIQGKSARESADIANEAMGVSKAQEAAMLAGSMFGWDAPAANPKNYDENGKAIKSKKKEYER